MKKGILHSREQLPDRVLTMLFADIEAGLLRPGEKLPTEQQLADRFGVSRNVLREAVAKLRADGVVETRQGIGTFVLGPEKRQVVRIDAASLQEGENMDRLFELRCVLETEAASLAAVRCDKEDLAKIAAALDRMSGEERWEDGSIDADLEFHRAIASATKNGFFYTFIAFIGERIRGSIEYARLTNPLHDLVAINVPEHVAIYDAIAAGSPIKAGEAMRSHIIGAAERVGVMLPGAAWSQPTLGTLLGKDET